MTTRRSFITGLISFAVTAPAIVRATSLMPIKAMVEAIKWPIYRESICGELELIGWKLPNPQWGLVHDVRDLWKLPSAAR